MSFDFFNQPEIPSSSKLIFTQNEKSCFARQIPILDPQNTHRISARSTLQLMKFSGLPNNLMKEIWILANPTSDDPLSYDQVQTIIRLVGYAQSGIPLTRENLERNLAHNQPVFQHESLASIPTNTALNPGMMSNGLSDTDILNYERVWAGIEGKNEDLLGGSEVKRLYQTAANKKLLAKAWTLCSQTQKGYLTKGELFVFIYLINLIKVNQEIPAELTPDMKNAIAKIDVNIRRGPPKQQPVKPQPTNESRRLQQVENVERRNLENLKGLVDGQTKFTNLVAWMEKYVEESEATMNQMQGEIERVKAAQVQTFEKMNGGIMRLQRVIQRQNLVIQELMNQLRNRDNTDQEHIRTLESVHEKQYDKSGISISRPVQRRPESPSQPSQGNFQKKSSIQEPKASVREPQPQPEPEQNSQHKDNPLDAYQIQTLNLLNQVRPISPEELPGIQKRIMAMSKDELQEFYAEVVKRYQQLQQEKEKEAAAVEKENHKSPNSSDLEFVAGILGNVEVNPDEMKEPEEDFFK